VDHFNSTLTMLQLGRPTHVYVHAVANIHVRKQTAVHAPAIIILISDNAADIADSSVVYGIVGSSELVTDNHHTNPAYSHFSIESYYRLATKRTERILQVKIIDR